MGEFSFLHALTHTFPVFPKCRQQQELIMKLLQQTPQQQGPGAGGSGWSGASSSGLSKAGKPSALALLEMQQEAERILKQQQQQQRAQQRDRVSSHSGSARHSPEPFVLVDVFETAGFLCSRAALGHVDGQLLHGQPVGGQRGDVVRARGPGEQGRQWRLVGRHGHVGRGREEPVGPARQLQQQHGLEEQPQQPLTEVPQSHAGRTRNSDKPPNAPCPFGHDIRESTLTYLTNCVLNGNLFRLQRAVHDATAQEDGG